MLRFCHRFDAEGKPKRNDDARAFGADDVAASGVMFRKLRFQMIADMHTPAAVLSVEQNWLFCSKSPAASTFKTHDWRGVEAWRGCWTRPK